MVRLRVWTTITSPGGFTESPRWTDRLMTPSSFSRSGTRLSVASAGAGTSTVWCIRHWSPIPVSLQPGTRDQRHTPLVRRGSAGRVPPSLRLGDSLDDVEHAVGVQGDRV